MCCQGKSGDKTTKVAGQVGFFLLCTGGGVGVAGVWCTGGVGAMPTMNGVKENTLCWYLGGCGVCGVGMSRGGCGVNANRVYLE